MKIKSPDNSKPPIHIDAGPKSKYQPSPEQQKRLDLLKSVVAVFEENHVRYSIVGGYGIDGLRGELTRDHNDFDMLIDPEDIDRARALLASVDFKRKKDKTSGMEVYVHNLTKTKLELANMKLVRAFFQGDELMLIPPVPNGSLDAVSFKVATLEGQRITRDIQYKRHGERGPNVDHDEKILEEIERKLKI